MENKRRIAKEKTRSFTAIGFMNYEEKLNKASLYETVRHQVYKETKKDIIQHISTMGFCSGIKL